MMYDDEEIDILIPRNVHPGLSEDNPEVSMQYLDSRIATAFPQFDEQFWRFSAVVRWIQERTPQAVDGCTVDERFLETTLTELHEALKIGEIHAHGIMGPEPAIREIPKATWSAYVMGYELRNGLIYLHLFRSGADFPDRCISHLRFERREVLARWPSRCGTAAVPSTAGAEHECTTWLRETMQASPGQPRPKSGLKDEALQKFPKLSGRGFDRAWDRAIAEAGAENWSRPGRRARGGAIAR